MLLSCRLGTLQVGWYVKGLFTVASQLPAKMAHLRWQGFALVGLGSFVFHATLLFSAQLADELPMVYVASYFSAALFDTQPGFDIYNARSIGIGIILVVFNVLFTLA